MAVKKDNQSKFVKLKAKYGEPKKCICGYEEFRITYKDKSYSMHCNQCGMFCGHVKGVDLT